MSSLVLSLLPSQRETIQDLQARYSKLLSCVAHGLSYDGLPVHKNDIDTQNVMRALVSAIVRRKHDERDKPQQDKRTFNYRPQRRRTGKTEKDRNKEGYVPPDEKKKQKSRQSQEIRSNMRCGKGK